MITSGVEGGVGVESQVMSETLLSLSRLSVVVSTTGEHRTNNRKASLAALRCGTEVNEATKFVVDNANVKLYGEKYLHCVGSLGVGKEKVLMTHHNADDIGYLHTTMNEIERVAVEVEKLRGGVAVIWRKSFSGLMIEDSQYRDTAELWYTNLTKIYSKHAFEVYDMVFSEWDWPLSAYYNGAKTLTLVGNTEDFQKLLQPTVSRLK